MSKSAEEIRIEFYGKDDARAFEHDEISIMKSYAESRIKEFVKEVQKEFPETNLEYLTFAADRFNGK